MSYPVIEVEPRAVKGSNHLNSLRRDGKTPGIIYGHAETYKPQLIQFDELPFRRQLAAGRKFFKVKGTDSDLDAFVAEVQVDELTDRLLHVDFQRIQKGDQITLKIPLRIKGTPAGARIGGRLEVFLHEIKIQGSPENMVEEFVLDVSGLEVSDRVTLGTLKLPEGVMPVGQSTTTICIVHPPKGARGPQKDSDDDKDDEQKK